MITQTARPLESLVDTTANNIGLKVRISLRQLGILHMYRREKKFYTFDVPFQLMSSKDGNKIIVVISKASLPRKYSPRHLWDAKDRLEVALGMPIQIREAGEVIAVCCQIPKSSTLSIAG
jgi:hypothetical protein